MANEYVLDQVNEKRKFLNNILERKKQLLGHILRGETLLKEVIEGRIEGKKGRRKPISKTILIKEKINIFFRPNFEYKIDFHVYLKY